jgi:hypothetical protein
MPFRAYPFASTCMIPLWYHDAMALTLRTDEELENALTELSSTLKTSRQDVIRTAVLEMRSNMRHDLRVSDAFDHVQESWGHVIKRLAST